MMPYSITTFRRGSGHYCNPLILFDIKNKVTFIHQPVFDQAGSAKRVVMSTGITQFLALPKLNAIL
ncbi:hypothetical protein THII_0539 [Thioploca ingrica]|uniref:Uncharacterized protein n=1 Tax=Thioploca ingrica TaxID=40754 RepID=A0A090BUB9_9GAMM|nr:hypothetical protein THII_0539 [Thioploca ingrica]